jgi:hypothetical protein
MLKSLMSEKYGFSQMLYDFAKHCQAGKNQ